MDARIQLFRRRKALALLSHSHEVTGMVQAMVKRTEMFGKAVASHFLMAFAGEHGLFSGSIAIYLFLQRPSPASINSGDGRSYLYLISASSRLTSCEHMILSARPSTEMAVTADFANCRLMLIII